LWQDRILHNYRLQKKMHSNTRKLRTKPWIFYWSYYTLFWGSNISNPLFFYWLLKWWNYSPPYITYNHVGTYFQCYGRSNEFINFTFKELNWTYFLSHMVSKIPIVTPPWSPIICRECCNCNVEYRRFGSRWRILLYFQNQFAMQRCSNIYRWRGKR
jgi:hypothetical protein